MKKMEYLGKKEIRNRLKEKMLQHRDKLGLKQREVAELLDKDEKTYQRLESTGNGLSDFFDIQNIFRVLEFSTTDIIDVLGFPPLTLNEIKELYQDEETLKSIRENGICSSIRQTCNKMENITIEKLLYILLIEHLKRRGIKV